MIIKVDRVIIHQNGSQAIIYEPNALRCIEKYCPRCWAGFLRRTSTDHSSFYCNIRISMWFDYTIIYFTCEAPIEWAISGECIVVHGGCCWYFNLFMESWWKKKIMFSFLFVFMSTARWPYNFVQLKLN